MPKQSYELRLGSFQASTTALGTTSNGRKADIYIAYYCILHGAQCGIYRAYSTGLHFQFEQ
jgi:hypothetical protein